MVDGVRPDRTFREAATKYLLDNQHLSSIVDMGIHLRGVLPYIGALSLRQVHMGTLQAYIDDRRKAGIRQKTINNALATVRRVLNLAARLWRDDHGLTWLETPPLIQLLAVVEKAEPYPLDWDQQRELFRRLPGYIANPALFKVNTGLREMEVCALKWDWEVRVPDLETSVFLIPKERIKNKEDRLVVMNSIARSVVDSCRGIHPEYVFTYQGRKLLGLRGTAWRKAWKNSGLPQGRNIVRGVHTLKHTFGRRLRAAGVPLETRKVLLGHRNGEITTHYSAAELNELIHAVEKVVDQRPGTLLRRVV